MAEQSRDGSSSKPKRQRKANAEGRIQCGLVAELPDNEESRLRKETLQRRLEAARSKLGIVSKGKSKTTRTGNADLFEALKNL